MDFSLPEEHTAIRAAVRELCTAYPDAYWRELDSHKGYPTAVHRWALWKHGPCPLHRLRFHGVAADEMTQTELFD